MADVPVSEIQDFLIVWSRERFDWRTHNCGHFVAAWLRHRTGEIVPPDMLCGYSTPLGFRRKLKRAGFDSLVGLADSILPGRRRKDEPNPGDIIVAPLVLRGAAGREIFGLSLGGAAIVVPAENGILSANYGHVLAAWRVER